MKRLSSWLSSAMLLALNLLPLHAVAADSPPVTSLERLVLGLMLVLLVIAAVAWLVRRCLPGQARQHTALIKQVGGLALGPRERVAVLEIGGRWLVVGVHAGHMTALAELPAQTANTAETAMHAASDHAASGHAAQADVTGVDPSAPFAVRLQQAMQQTLQQRFKPAK